MVSGRDVGGEGLSFFKWPGHWEFGHAQWVHEQQKLIYCICLFFFSFLFGWGGTKDGGQIYEDLEVRVLGIHDGKPPNKQ